MNICCPQFSESHHVIYSQLSFRLIKPIKRQNITCVSEYYLLIVARVFTENVEVQLCSLVVTKCMFERHMSEKYRMFMI